MSSEIQGSTSEDLKSGSEKIKRPLNAFILWSKKRRRVIANENPQMHNFDISRKLGLEWQKLTEEEKSYYFDEAKRLKEEHKQRYPHYKYQPRKRDKTNKRGKIFQGAPFHFGFFPPAPPYYESRYPFGIPDGRVPYPETPLPAMVESLSPAGSEEPSPTTPASSSSPIPVRSPSSSSEKSSPTICPATVGFRQPSEGGYVSYRSYEPSYMHLRPSVDFPHWYSGSSAASRITSHTVPYYSCGLYPWHSRPEYHS